jgi:hypothetical protein
MNPNNKPNGKPAPMVKVAGLYKCKRKRDGKTYLTGRASLFSKFLVLPNEEKSADNEPDFWLFAVDSPKEFPKPQ